jgi:hypothetical protein
MKIYAALFIIFEQWCGKFKQYNLQKANFPLLYALQK